MKLYNGYYKADNGKHFVLTEKGQSECAGYKYKIVGEPVDIIDTEASKRDVDKHYLEEVEIPGWTKLKGYQVVYYYHGHRLFVGNTQTFPTEKAAARYKKHYKSYPWMNHPLLIETVEYEGVPLKEYSLYNGEEVIDKEHYFGLETCEAGDYFAEELINDFVDMLPPACMRSGYFQIGEPIFHQMDKDGKERPAFATFEKIDFENRIWKYCGSCFRGETVSCKAA